MFVVCSTGTLICAILAATDLKTSRAQNPPCGVQQQNAIKVEFIESNYRTAQPVLTSGFFRNGQSADLMLAGVDFNQTGGPLLFNHNGGIATDGVRLLLADRNNNRVLVWNQLPDGNVPPDLVLGQPDFNGNNPGRGRNQMNWPIAVATDGRRVVVADAYNDRLLIWNSFPTQSGAPADLSINIGWPWGVWTDGRKLAASSTASRSVQIWNEFPTQDNQAPNLRLTGQGNIGTPRSITSDGRSLIVGDHNSKATAAGQGSFVWKSFPTTDDAPFDYFLTDPVDERAAWLQGAFLPDGKLALLGRALHFWNGVPESNAQRPALTIQSYNFNGGDGSSSVFAGGRLYLSVANSNKIVVYRSIPQSPTQPPDFAIGSPDICANTLDTNFFITNPVPSSNGVSLFASSDFDRKLSVWKRLPDQSGARPDIVYTLPGQAAPWQNALWKNNLALAGNGTVYVWRQLPLDGQLPELTFNNNIGSVRLQSLSGVAMDDRYFYLSVPSANKVYVWEGIPSASSNPVYELSVNQPDKLSTDGQHLVVNSTFTHSALIFRVAELSNSAVPTTVGGVGRFNLPQHTLVSQGRLFVADTGFNRVHGWNRIEDALAGRPADAVMGSSDLRRPEIGRNSLFWPGAVAFDGLYLWVGEFKFSGRLLRFTPGEPIRVPPRRAKA
jgi:hypothetical protein